MTTVAVDARRAVWMPGTGIGRYAGQICRQGTGRAVQVVPVVAQGQALPGAAVVGPGLGQLQRIAWEQFTLPRAARREGWDVIHAPYYETAVASRVRVVVTIQDLHTIHSAHEYAAAFRLYYNSVLRVLARRAALVIVPSQATADDVAALWPRLQPRLRVIPYGHDEALLRVAAGRTAPALGEAPPTVLYTGGYGARKRLDVLIDAFAQVAQADGRARLVLVGRVPDDVAGLVERAGIAARTDRPGFVSEEELRAAYAAAAVAVYPSEHEGFGFPALEALTAGVPLVASGTSSIPEITGACAALTEPGDVDAVAAGILEALARPAAVQQRVEAGLERAAGFSWDRCRAAHDAVYLEVA